MIKCYGEQTCFAREVPRLGYIQQLILFVLCSSKIPNWKMSDDDPNTKRAINCDYAKT